MQNKDSVSLGTIVGLINKIAQKYIVEGATGVKNIEVNPEGTGIIVTMTDGTVYTLYFTKMMLKGTYDLINDGTIGVDNARKLAGNLPSYYTTSLNATYDRTKVANLVSTNVQDAIDETSGLVFRTDDKVVRLENEIVSDFVNNLYEERTLKDVALNHSKLISNEKAEHDLSLLDIKIGNLIKGILDNIATLTTETETNNMISKNIIKGDYLTTDISNIIILDKTPSGVTINASNIKSQLDTISTQGLLNETAIDDLNLITGDIVRGQYLNIKPANGMNIEKTQANGVLLGMNNATKIQKGVVSVGDGINVSAEGAISVDGTQYIPSIEKGAINGICPLDINKKVDNNYLYQTPTIIPFKKDIYSLSEMSSIINPQPNPLTNYRQTCISKSDARYNNTTATNANFNLVGQVSMSECFSGTITDVGVIDGQYNGATLYTNFYAATSLATNPIMFYARVFLREGISGNEIVLGTSNTVMINKTALSYYSIPTDLSNFLALKDSGDRLCIKLFAARTVQSPATTLTYSLEGAKPSYSTLYYANNRIGISDVLDLPQSLNGEKTITDIALTNKPYKLSQLIDLESYTNETIYIRNGVIPSNVVRNGSEIAPYNSISNAIAVASATRNIVQILDGSTYNDNFTIPSTITNFISPHATINGNITIDSANAYVIIGNVIGNITLTKQCTLIINGRLKGTITSNTNIQSYIRVNYIDETAFPVTIPNAKVANGSVIGRYQYGMVAK